MNAPGGKSPARSTDELWRGLAANPAGLTLALGLMALGLVLVGALGARLLAPALFQGNEQAALGGPLPVRSEPADRTATVRVDDAGARPGLVSVSVVEWRTQAGVSQMHVRIDNRSDRSVPVGGSDFTMPDAAPPVPIATPPVPSSLPAGEAVEVWLAFTGDSQVLLWCPQLQPGTCIRL